MGYGLSPHANKARFRREESSLCSTVIQQALASSLVLSDKNYGFEWVSPLACVFSSPILEHFAKHLSLHTEMIPFLIGWLASYLSSRSMKEGPFQFACHIASTPREETRMQEAQRMVLWRAVKCLAYYVCKTVSWVAFDQARGLLPFILSPQEEQQNVWGMQDLELGKDKSQQLGLIFLPTPLTRRCISFKVLACQVMWPEV